MLQQTMWGHVTFVLLAVVAFLGSLCFSQLTVRSMMFRSHIRYRFATTVVTSTVINDDATSRRDALFELALPEEAFIANFSMTVDGVVYPGRVEEKQAAMKAYQTAKKRGQSAGYIKTTARHSNKFDVSVSLKPGSMVTFNLTYQQLLARSSGMYRHKMHINPGRVIRDLKVEVFVEESRKITSLETSLKMNLEENRLSEEEVTVVEPSARSRYIVYTPTLEQQKKAGDNGINGKFTVSYDVERTSAAGELVLVDGYFLHYFAPENSGDFEPLPKDIVFVLDVSGSMTGTKIRQLKQAMSTILTELRPEDRFNIFPFNDRVWKWNMALVEVNSKTVRQSTSFVNELRADGSTDINMALTSAVEFLMNHRNRNHVPLIFFLTDGQPTSGVKDPASIANNVERSNEAVASVFGLAFGEGADYNLLKIVSVQNGGFARKIYEAGDASQQVKGFYDEISNAMLQNLTITYLNGTVQPDTVTQTTFREVFKGNDVVVAGKITQYSPNNKITGVVTARTNKGTISIVLDNNTDGITLEPDPQENPYFQMPVDFASVTEKSWAYLTIKDLLKQKQKATYKDKNGGQDLDKQILAMSLKYKFVTPLTSMVATKPEDKTSQATVEGDDYEKEDIKAVAAQGRRRLPSGSPLGINNNAHISRVMSHMKSYVPHVSGIQHSPGSIQFDRFQRHQFSGQGMAAFPPRPAYPAFMTNAPVPSVVHTPSAGVLKSSKNMKKKKKQKTRRRKPRTCKLGRVLASGIGITVNSNTRCVKFRRSHEGTYQFYPATQTDTADISVQATFTKVRRFSNLDAIRIVIKGDNRTYNIILDPHHTNSTSWKSPDSTVGHVTINKHATCRGRRGKAKIFVNIHLPDQQTDGKSKRDVKKWVRSAIKKAKKKSSSFRNCQGRITKEVLNAESPRFVASGSSVATGTVETIKF